ncbi:MAG: MFS transporter, partial [Acidimicrobiales bacterium]
PAGSAGAARPSPWAALARMGRRDRLGRLVLVAFLGAVAFSAFEATFSLLGARRVGLTIASAGLVFAAVGLLLAVVQGALVGRAVAAFGEARVLRVGLLANLAGLVLLAPSAGWATLAPAVGLLTLGQGLLTPALSSAVSAAAPPAERGAVMGVQQSAAAAARLVGPAAALAVFDVAGPAWLYLLGAALMALALALASRA